MTSEDAPDARELAEDQARWEAEHDRQITANVARADQQGTYDRREEFFARFKAEREQNWTTPSEPPSDPVELPTGTYDRQIAEGEWVVCCPGNSFCPHRIDYSPDAADPVESAEDDALNEQAAADHAQAEYERLNNPLNNPPTGTETM